MEKIREEEITITKRVHEFTCDRCGETLGSVREYLTEDGIFQTSPFDYCDFDSSVSLPNQNLYIYRCLCRKCQQEEEKELSEKLREIGYTEPTL